MNRDQLPIPVQLISSCSTLGELTPIRFRYEDPEHVRHTVSVLEVLSRRDTTIAGIPEMTYVCHGEFEQTRHLFQLRYHIPSHKWSIVKVMY